MRRCCSFDPGAFVAVVLVGVIAVLGAGCDADGDPSSASRDHDGGGCGDDTTASDDAGSSVGSGATDGAAPTPGGPPSGEIRVVSVMERQRPEAYASEWTTVVTHTHNLRTGEVGFERATSNLLEWTRRHDIDAVGVGSPWEPVSKSRYLHYEGAGRDEYYAGRVDPASVMDREPIRQLFETLNRRSEGTFFYQDNETPKHRYGHVWYLGYEYDVPAWHDYSQGRPVKVYEADPHVEINPLTGEPHWRRSCLEVAWGQRDTGAVPVWAHPTSWWGDRESFTSNIAVESLLHLVVDGRLGGLSVMGYDAFHASYQALWFHYLDTGAVVPGFAETDYSLDAADLPSTDVVFVNYLETGGAPLSSRALADAARSGRHFASTGPYVTVAADGAAMGEVTETAAGAAHSVAVEAYPAPGQSELARLELVGRGGEVLHAIDDFSGGIVELELGGRDIPHYLIARAYGQDDNPDGPAKEVRHLALSNPVYFHPAGFRYEPVTTDMRLTVREDSEWIGGRLEIQRADGRPIEAIDVTPGALRRTVPGNARVHLSKEGREERRFHVAIENERAQELMRRLYEGDFLDDHPELEPGEVPPEAFDVEAMREALGTFRHEI